MTKGELERLSNLLIKIGTHTAHRCLKNPREVDNVQKLIKSTCEDRNVPPLEMLLACCLMTAALLRDAAKLSSALWVSDMYDKIEHPNVMLDLTGFDLDKGEN